MGGGGGGEKAFIPCILADYAYCYFLSPTLHSTHTSPPFSFLYSNRDLLSTNHIPLYTPPSLEKHLCNIQFHLSQHQLQKYTGLVYKPFSQLSPKGYIS